MNPALLADAVLVLHGLFIVWVLAGALLVLAWVHLPAVAWGIWIEFSHGICPLTPLEQSLRHAAGQAGYEGGFVEHYLGALIYPAGLTWGRQLMLGAAVLAINLAIYAFVAHRVISGRRTKESER
jgi:hypothetical protein